MPKEILSDPRQLISQLGEPLPKFRRWNHFPVLVADGFPNSGRVFALSENKSDAESLAKGLNSLSGGGYKVGSEIQIEEEYTELNGEKRAHGIGPYNKNGNGVKGDVYHWERKK